MNPKRRSNIKKCRCGICSLAAFFNYMNHRRDPRHWVEVFQAAYLKGGLRKTLTAVPVLAEPQSTTLPEDGETVSGEARESTMIPVAENGVTDSRDGSQTIF